MKKTFLDDGFHNYLVDSTAMVGDPGIPMLLDLHNTTIPLDLVPFSKCRKTKNKRQYIHFYEHDFVFSPLLCSAWKYLDLFKKFDGIITPDCTMLIGQSACLQQTNTYFNRAVGSYFQHRGIPVIANIRWSDENSFSYCFLGVPQKTIVSISTHGCIRSNLEKSMFRRGIEAMLEALHPTDVLVHGYMPPSVFSPFASDTNFHRYQSQFEKTHVRREA